MTNRIPVKTTLRSGQFLRLYADRGTSIVALRGSVEIGVVAWLGEQMLQPRQVLHEGEAHVVPAAGGITIAARGNAEILCLEAAHSASLLQRLLAPLALLARRLEKGS